MDIKSFYSSWTSTGSDEFDVEHIEQREEKTESPTSFSIEGDVDDLYYEYPSYNLVGTRFIFDANNFKVSTDESLSQDTASLAIDLTSFDVTGTHKWFKGLEHKRIKISFEFV